MALLREPLFHFLASGVVLFAAFSFFGTERDVPGDNTIVVDRRALLTFLQYRANAFDAETFGAALDAMTEDEIQDLVDAYVNEEILYREARALGLDESDNIIRQRLAQKMNFLIADMTTVEGAADADTLADYYSENIENYAVAPWATFTHVFFDAEKRGADGALSAARDALVELNTIGAGFNDAPQHGDSFPFLRNYVERTLDYVASHFGFEFAASVETLPPSSERWQGPIRSAYGQHVVLLTERAERRYPGLDEVRADVERDFAAEQSNAALEDVVRQVRRGYTVRVDDIRSQGE